jgi:hypothetical protein
VGVNVFELNRFGSVVEDNISRPNTRGGGAVLEPSFLPRLAGAFIME